MGGKWWKIRGKVQDRNMMPPNHQIVLFPRGVTTLACITGKEHKDMCQILLGLIIDL